jgi:hypothetical protein
MYDIDMIHCNIPVEHHESTPKSLSLSQHDGHDGCTPCSVWSAVLLPSPNSPVLCGSFISCERRDFVQVGSLSAIVIIAVRTLGDLPTVPHKY